MFKQHTSISCPCLLLLHHSLALAVAASPGGTRSDAAENLLSVSSLGKLFGTSFKKLVVGAS